VFLLWKNFPEVPKIKTERELCVTIVPFSQKELQNLEIFSPHMDG
jgi:hypothetical protein